MQPILVKNTHCFCCDTPTPLLASSLEGKLGYRSTSSTYGIEIFFACPHCKTVGQSSIPVQSERRTILGGQQSPADIVPFCVLLECAQAGCEFRISILGAAKKGTMHSQVQNMCRTWKFGREVQCEEMHRPAQPPQIAGVIFGE